MLEASAEHSGAVSIPARGVTLSGDLTVPPAARGIVLFAHGSGSSRLSPRNRQVAGDLNAAGFATLLFDLLTPAEEEVDAMTRRFRFDVTLLAQRLADVTDWVGSRPETAALPIGYFGASTGAAAALVAAVLRPQAVHAVVSRGGRPDLAGPILPRVRAPTLLLVGSEDRAVTALNRSALGRLAARGELVLVPGATHLFEEPGALETVGELACKWFGQYLAGVAKVAGHDRSEHARGPFTLHRPAHQAREAQGRRGTKRREDTMRVAELMRRNVKTISPDATVGELVVELADAHVSGLPVVDDRGRMIGVVSKTDVVAAEAEADDEGPWSLKQMLVRDLMTPRPLTIGPEADVADAAQQMMYAGVHRLFVVADDELVGVVSTSDVSRALATRRL